MMKIKTPRLLLRWLEEKDAPFIYQLVNTKEWLQNIGDRRVRNIDDALNYIRNTHFKNYEQNGFGYFLVQLKNNETPIGVCGLLNRSTLPGPDIGFAFLPPYFGKGYAYESASAIMHHAFTHLQLPALYAIVLPANFPSVKLIGRLQFVFQGNITQNDDPEILKLYKREVFE